MRKGAFYFLELPVYRLPEDEYYEKRSTDIHSAQREDGGVEWTIKDGIPYHAPTLLADARRIVAEARAESTKE